MSNKYPCVYYDNGKCQKFSDEKYNSWCDFDQCEHQTPSNADHIRSMTDEELAKWVTEFVELVLEANGMCDEYELHHEFESNMLEEFKQPYKEDA